MRNQRGIIAFLLGCLLLSATAVSAQTEARLGAKAGLSMYNFSGDAVWKVNADSRVFVDFGVFAEIGVARNIAIRPELNYVSKGASRDYVVDVGGAGPLSVTEDAKLTYLQVPVLVKYTFPLQGKVQPSIFVGPAIAFNVSGKDDISGYGDSRDGNKDIANVKSTDFSGIVGAAVSFPLGKMTGSFGVRYDMSFGKAFDDMDPNSVPENEVAFLQGDLEYWDPIDGNYTNNALDMTNYGFSFDFMLSMPIGSK